MKRDYRELRQLANAFHDRFSELNYDTSMSLSQKLNILLEYFKNIAKDWEEVLAYLKEFEEKFDEKLYQTVEDIFNKWLESGIFDDLIADIVLKIGNFDGFRPWDEKLIDKIKNEFSERGYNIKWFGAVEGQFVDTIINNMIQTLWSEEKGLTIFIPNGTFYTENSIVIDKSNVKIFGGGKSNLEFSQTDNTIVAEKINMVSIGKNDGDGEITRIIIDGVNFIRGIQSCDISVTCLDLNRTRKQATALTDSSFKNVRIYNFNLGLSCIFSWGLLFENIRFQNNSRPMQLDSQTNNVLFNRVSFVSFKDFIMMTNNEGIEMNSCEIANSTANYAISIFQSSLTMINPYIENITNKELIRVGNFNEASSSLIEIFGGKVTDSETIIKHNSSMPPKISITQTYGGDIKIQPTDVADSERTVITDYLLPNTFMKYKFSDLIVNFDGSVDVTFPKAWNNEGDFTQTYDTANRKKVITYSGVSSLTQGLLVNGTVKGEYYTVIYNINKSNTMYFRNGAKPATLMKTFGEKDCYLLIKADSTSLRFEITGGQTIDLNKLIVLKGIKLPL